MLLPSTVSLPHEAASAAHHPRGGPSTCGGLGSRILVLPIPNPAAFQGLSVVTLLGFSARRSPIAEEEGVGPPGDVEAQSARAHHKYSNFHVSSSLNGNLTFPYVSLFPQKDCAILFI